MLSAAFHLTLSSPAFHSNVILDLPGETALRTDSVLSVLFPLSFPFTDVVCPRSVWASHFAHCFLMPTDLHLFVGALLWIWVAVLHASALQGLRGEEGAFHSNSHLAYGKVILLPLNQMRKKVLLGTSPSFEFSVFFCFYSYTFQLFKRDIFPPHLWSERYIQTRGKTCGDTRENCVG